MVDALGMGCAGPWTQFLETFQCHGHDYGHRECDGIPTQRNELAQP